VYVSNVKRLIERKNTMKKYIAVVCLLALNGCTMLAYQDVQRRHENDALRGVILEGARGPAVGVGINLAALTTTSSWSLADLGEEAAGIAADLGTGYGAYRLYEAAKGNSATALPASITTGNDSPVVISTGNGAASAANPNIQSGIKARK
jgi:hypothetical protein